MNELELLGLLEKKNKAWNLERQKKTFSYFTEATNIMNMPVGEHTTDIRITWDSLQDIHLYGEVPLAPALLASNTCYRLKS